MSHTYDDITVTIRLTLEVDSEVDVEAMAQRLFDFLADDPDNLFPGIMVVLDYRVEK